MLRLFAIGPRLLGCGLLSLWLACGGSERDGGGGGDAGMPSAPLWTGTTEVTVGQGRTLAVPVETADADGDPVRVLVTAPADLEAVVTGDTLALAPTYDVNGVAEVILGLDDGTGRTSQATLAVTVPPIRWLGREQFPTGPEAREHGALVVDDVGRRVILVGGSGYSPYLEPLDDVWAWDLESGAWTRLTPSGDVPSGGGSRRVAQIPGERRAFLFGGYGPGGASHNELYEVDYSGADPAFRRVTQSPAPLARSLHAFSYDPVSKRFVAFGGVGNAIRGDTLIMTLDGGVAVWTELGALDPSPSARYGFFHAFDPEAGRLVLFSGAQGKSSVDPAQDTWELDVRADPPEWHLLAEGAAAGVPPGRRNGAFAFDPTGPRMFVFGGTADAMSSEEGLFVFDMRTGRDTWHELTLADAPPVRSSGFGFFDPGAARVHLGFGNTASAVYSDFATIGY